jgi:hypothetical protein
MMEGLEEMIDDMLGDLEECVGTGVLPSRYKDKEYLRELDILIEEYEE